MEESTFVLHPTYFGPISQYVAIAKANLVIFEDFDNYQKQTYRNRTYIYGANGKLLLSVPFQHSGKERLKYRDVKIQNEFNWQVQHRKSLETAYRTSPFFEYYEDDFYPLFDKKYTYLLDFNYTCFEVVRECLNFEIEFQKTTTYQKQITKGRDLRFLVNAKKKPDFQFSPYTQVFSEKYGFINNLSILDLLFNEGPNSMSYLKEQLLPAMSIRSQSK